jgi:imidazolonepropionase-like amidohydrolase
VSAVRILLAPMAVLALLAGRHAPAAPAPASGYAAADVAADVAAARAVFERNLDAIRHRDRAAYLSCYLQSPLLARTGPTGFALSYDSLAAGAGSGWPDHFEGLDLRLTPIHEGLVYGTYRYRVRYGADEQSGLSERLFVETPEGWKIAMTSAFAATPGVPAPPRAVVGGTLLDGTDRPAIADAVVLVRDGRIEAAGPRRAVKLPAGVDTVDARGKFVVPGLIDTHVHFSQTGWADGRPDALDLRDEFPYEQVEERLRAHPEVFQRAYLASGVTTVFDVGGYPWTVAMAHEAEANTDAPHVSAAGPLLSTLDFWLNLPAERQFMYLADSAAAVQGVRYLKSIGAAAVKVWFIVRPGSDLAAMSRNVARAGAEARRLGLPLIVHATGLPEAKAALRAGARLLVHSVMEGPVDAEFLKLAKDAGAYYCPTITVIDGYAKLPAAARSGIAPTVDDPMGAVDSLTRAHVGLTPGEARRVMGGSSPSPDSVMAARHRFMDGNLLAVRRAGIPIATGTDAGNPLTLHGPAIFAEMEAMQHAGMTPIEVLRASTRDAARAMGRGDELGTIEKGKSADLLVLDADPRRDIAACRKLRIVMRSGVARTTDELRAAVAKTRW